MIWKRSLLVALLTLTGLAVQTSVFREVTLAGTKPPVLLLVTIAIALSEGAAPGATAGFVSGLMIDVLMPRPVGVTALVFTVIGYLAGRVRMQVASPTVWLPVLMVFTGTLLGMLSYGAVSALLGEAVASPGMVARHAALGAAYNSLLTPFLFPVVRAIARRLRPGTVLEGPSIKAAP